jgi:hypothetical protein
LADSKLEAYAIAEGVAELPGPRKDCATQLMCIKDGHTKKMTAEARLRTEVSGYRGKRRNFLTDRRLRATNSISTSDDPVKRWIKGHPDKGQRRWLVESLYRWDNGQEVSISEGGESWQGD